MCVISQFACVEWLTHTHALAEKDCYLIYEVERVKIVHCGVFTMSRVRRGMDKTETYLALHARFSIFPHFPAISFFVSLAQQKTV